MSTVKKYEGYDVPVGSQRFRVKTNEFYKKEGDVIYFWDTSCWEGVASGTTGWDLSVELPQEPETFVPVAGEWCEHICADLEEAAFIIGRNKDGNIVFQNKQSDVFYCDNEVFFHPLKSEREKIKEWVESKIDCVEAFEMDQAIMISLMLDLGCLIIPETDKC